MINLNLESQYFVNFKEHFVVKSNKNYMPCLPTMNTFQIKIANITFRKNL